MRKRRTTITITLFCCFFHYLNENRFNCHIESKKTLMKTSWSVHRHQKLWLFYPIFRYVYAFIHKYIHNAFNHLIGMKKKKTTNWNYYHTDWRSCCPLLMFICLLMCKSYNALMCCSSASDWASSSKEIYFLNIIVNLLCVLPQSLSMNRIFNPKKKRTSA